MRLRPKEKNGRKSTRLTAFALAASPTLVLQEDALIAGHVIQFDMLNEVLKIAAAAAAVSLFFPSFFCWKAKQIICHESKQCQAKAEREALTLSKAKRFKNNPQQKKKEAFELQLHYFPLLSPRVRRRCIT